MRYYECSCLLCGHKKQLPFLKEPYPAIGEVFLFHCSFCDISTEHTRVLTKKAKAEIRRKEQEELLRSSIVERCESYGFHCRFLFQSVIVTTPLSDWCFDYHISLITLYHESTVKINRETGNYAKSHVQFRNKKMNPLEVIDYIAKHDIWKANQS